jgi:hypothetical protein
VAVDDAGALPPLPRPLDSRAPGGFGWDLVQSRTAVGACARRDRQLREDIAGRVWVSNDGP